VHKRCTDDLLNQKFKIVKWGGAVAPHAVSTIPQNLFDDISGNNCAQTIGLRAHSFKNDKQMIGAIRI